jgi:hypothetical protein
MVSEDAKVEFQLLVDALRLTISLRMVGGGRVHGYTKPVVYVLHE